MGVGGVWTLTLLLVQAGNKLIVECESVKDIMGIHRGHVIMAYTEYVLHVIKLLVQVHLNVTFAITTQLYNLCTGYIVTSP